MNKKIDISNEAKMENTIGIVMRIGVCVAAVFLLFGFILLILPSNNEIQNFSQINLVEIFFGLFKFNPYSYMLIGILFLILTPVLRVVSTIVLFAIEKDKLYTAITILVLIILIVSFLLGLSNH